MSLTLRSQKGSPLTFSEMDGNLTYLEGLVSVRSSELVDTASLNMIGNIQSKNILFEDLVDGIADDKLLGMYVIVEDQFVSDTYQPLSYTFSLNRQGNDILCILSLAPGPFRVNLLSAGAIRVNVSHK